MALLITSSPNTQPRLLSGALVQALRPLVPRMAGRVVTSPRAGVLVAAGMTAVSVLVPAGGSITAAGWPSTPQAETIVTRRPR
jgi:hypothetical protein